MRVCTIEDCNKKHLAKGLCRTHYRRQARFGTTALSKWTGTPGYAGAHYRVRAVHGVASLHRCTRCPNQATDWAYDGQDPNELMGLDKETILPYSLDINHYRPLCRTCHLKESLPMGTREKIRNHH